MSIVEIEEEPILDPSQLQPGDWLWVQYGTSYERLYVVENLPAQEQVLFGSPNWLADSISELNYEWIKAKASFICSSKLRWWWRFLPWRDCVCPFPKPRLF